MTVPPLCHGCFFICFCLFFCFVLFCLFFFLHKVGKGDASVAREEAEGTGESTGKGTVVNKGVGATEVR